jgi:hypothetical protein
LTSLLDKKNLIVIDHKLNDNFKNIIFRGRQGTILALINPN